MRRLTALFRCPAVSPGHESDPLVAARHGRPALVVVYLIRLVPLGRSPARKTATLDSGKRLSVSICARITDSISPRSTSTHSVDGQNLAHSENNRSAIT